MKLQLALVFAIFAIQAKCETCPEGFKEDTVTIETNDQSSQETLCFQTRNEEGDFEDALKIYSEEGQMLLEPKSLSEMKIFSRGNTVTSVNKQKWNPRQKSEEGFYVGIKSINNQ